MNIWRIDLLRWWCNPRSLRAERLGENNFLRFLKKYPHFLHLLFILINSTSSSITSSSSFIIIYIFVFLLFDSSSTWEKTIHSFFLSLLSFAISFSTRLLVTERKSNSTRTSSESFSSSFFLLHLTYLQLILKREKKWVSDEPSKIGKMMRKESESLFFISSFSFSSILLPSFLAFFSHSRSILPHIPSLTILPSVLFFFP